MNEQQVERFRQIIQEISNDEKVSFDEAFAIASNHLAYWISEMPKGRKASGCGSSPQAECSQLDHSTD